MIALVGCENAAEQGEPAPSARLSEVKIPEGFTFATSRSVKVQVAVDAALVGQTRGGTLEIARPDGRMLFQGAVTPDTPVNLELMVPTKDEKLSLRLKAMDGVERTAEVAVEDGALAYAFK